jgi:SAM-dependent methyltransferase
MKLSSLKGEVHRSLEGIYQKLRAALFPNAHAQNKMQELFGAGYDSGDIERGLDDPLILQEYLDTGANYKMIFDELIKPRLQTSRVILEIGPGKGSWTRAVLNHFHSGTLIVVDRLPVEDMLRERCRGAGERLKFYQTTDNDYSSFEDRSIDFVFSFGVFVHIPVPEIASILKRLRSKMVPGGEIILQYSNWDKLDKWGWERARVPVWFRDNPTHPKMWWTKNDCGTMERLSKEAGYDIESLDVSYFGTCSVLHLRA